MLATVESFGASIGLALAAKKSRFTGVIVSAALLG
jgi:hypothetical protein